MLGELLWKILISYYFHFKISLQGGTRLRHNFINQTRQKASVMSHSTEE